MILLKKAYCEKVIQIKAACHGNTQEIVWFVSFFLPHPPKKSIRERE